MSPLLSVGRKEGWAFGQLEHLPNGKFFTITADNLSEANGYVGSVRLNGQPLARTFIRHEEIMAGGELHFVMQPRPDKHWGAAAQSRPFSLSVSRSR